MPEVGRISRSELEPLVEWSIPVHLLRVPNTFESPHFRMSDTNWILTFNRTMPVLSQSEDSFGLFLVRKDFGLPRNITYTLGINAAGDNKTFTKSHIFDTEHACSETPDSVSCAVQTEIPYSVSCAVQTDIPNSVIHKENFKDEAWSSFDTKDVTLLSERMKDLLKKGSDHDVTICVQNKEFRAHRNILSARSPVFAMMLAHDTKESSTGTISIEDCDPDSFDEFLLYVYSGRTENLTPSKALQIYYTADKYDFPALKERCVSLLKTSLSVTSICDVILMAAKHGETELLKEASEYFARNIEEILITVGWQRFMSEHPVEANELYIKSIKFYLPRN